MANTNDERILAMKKKIEEKKEQIAKAKKFTPITNCSLEILGQRMNLHTLTETTLTPVLVSVNSIYLSVKDLGLEDTYKISGYLVSDWLTDLKAKLENLSLKEEERKLKQMESTLESMLSEDKQKELMLDEMEALLK